MHQGASSPSQTKSEPLKILSDLYSLEGPQTG